MTQPIHSNINIMVGAKVCMARRSAGMTLAQLGTKLSVNTQTIAAGEAGERRFTAVELLEITRALDVPVAYLLDPETR